MGTAGKASPTLTIGVSVLVFVGYLQLTGGGDIGKVPVLNDCRLI